MSVGDRVYDALQTASTQTVIGNNGETVQKQLKGTPSVNEARIKEAVVNYWNTVGPALLGPDSPTVEFRSLSLYDGTAKRSDPSQVHTDHFIPESKFHDMPDPDYSEFERNKRDETIVPIFDSNPDTEIDTRNGYRVIIKDDKVKDKSVVIPTVYYLDRSEENDLPVNYNHISPGYVGVINQKDGEVQLFFEQKGAYIVKYMLWNSSVNLETEPLPVEFKATP